MTGDSFDDMEHRLVMRERELGNATINDGDYTIRGWMEWGQQLKKQNWGRDGRLCIRYVMCVWRVNV